MNPNIVSRPESTRQHPLSSPSPALDHSSINYSLQGYEAIELEPLQVEQTQLRSAPIPIPRRASDVSLISDASSQEQSSRLQVIGHFVYRLSESVKKLDSKFNQRLRRSRFYGWRMGVLFGCCMSAFVLCCNVAVIIIGGNVNSGYDGDGISNIMFGHSSVISQWSTLFHLIINLFSTILLAASNYTMQVLSSPTRSDIDLAHIRGDWLDIGILSTRNLRRIPRVRTALWFLLALSSVPLHLL